MVSWRARDCGFEMTVAAGTKLGAYEILSPLGAGGMGETILDFGFSILDSR